jgi:arylsulfatase A-like enzyme
MTGLHTGHARIRDNFGRRGERVPLRTSDVTVARVLKDSGYRTACIGKWGLGEAGTAGVPNRQGFDEWFGFLNQDHALEYFPTHLWHNNNEVFPAGNQGAKRNDYVQELFTRRAVDYIHGAASSPFFLYLAFTLPHANSELGRDTGNGFPVPNFGPYKEKAWPAAEKGFAAVMSHLDDSVGRVMEALRVRNLDRNTLVIFTSDNGPALDGGHTPDFFHSRNLLRGRKGSLFEGGIRVPSVARWSGTVPADMVTDAPWAFWDFLPTAAELAGSDVCPRTDGRSILPLLRGERDRSERFFYWEQTDGGVFQQAMRIGKWKTLRLTGPGSKVALYDLSADAGEKVDQAGKHPEVVRQAEALFQKAHVESEEYPTRTEPPA